MSNVAVKAGLKGRKNLNVADDTYDRLRKHGQFGESFDELLNRLLDDIEGKPTKASKK
jgi:predicted CopG family antitoxin